MPGTAKTLIRVCLLGVVIELAGACAPQFCEGGTAHLYGPSSAKELELFPDDLWTRADETSPTGLRLDFSAETTPWVDWAPPIYTDTLERMGTLSGFGTNSGVLLRFSADVGELPSGWPDSIENSSLRFVDLGPGGPIRVPFEVERREEGQAVVLLPMRPLRQGVRHAVVLTRDHSAADGTCVRPSPTLRRLLTGSETDARFGRVDARHEAALETLGIEPDDVSAMTVFTTHADVAVLADIAATIRSSTPRWDVKPTCESRSNVLLCSGSFASNDYRRGGHVQDADSAAAWSVPVTLWLPPGGDGPFPTVVFGHGINSWRGDGAALASLLVPMGIAVAATDAVAHGEHPTNNGAAFPVLNFLGIDLTNVAVDGLALRGNFNQTALDRLHLIALLAASPDVDGDKLADIDGGRLGYYGISLGGMLGAGLLALSEDLEVAILAVAGGRLRTFVTDNDQLAPFRPALVDLAGSQEDFDRFLPVIQTAFDAGDPATFGPHILGDRLSGTGRGPSVLFYASTFDEVVPVPCGKALARAMAIPHFGPVFEPVALLPRAEGITLQGNQGEGARTAGFIQIDRVSTAGGVEASHHNNTPFSQEGRLLVERFLETWLQAGVPEIVDPFVERGTPPLPGP